jgi:hypothetical protein
VLFVLVVYMEVIPEPNIVSDRKKALLDDCQWPKHIKDPQQKQIKRQIFNIIMRGFFF